MKSESVNLNPFFSIGVTTYDRIEMLIETINSILEQTFSNFEVIVSNDNPNRIISSGSLGINDTRVKFINQPKTLGERSNMNFILGKAGGKYFTWFADDDLYQPNFLKTAYTAVINFGFPRCIFTAYTKDARLYKNNNTVQDSRLINGREFLGQYLSRSLPTLGCYGVFDIAYLRDLGGIGQLGKGFSYDLEKMPENVFFPYADNLLIIKSCLLEKIIYIDAPLIFYRFHKGSVSLRNTELEAYISAQDDLCNECVKIFNSEKLREDYRPNLSLLLKWCIKDFVTVSLRAGNINKSQLNAYFIFLKKYINFLKKTNFYWGILAFLIKNIFMLMLSMVKLKLKNFLNRGNKN